MTAIEYMEKLQKKTIYSLDHAKQNNSPQQDIDNLEEKLRCQDDILELLYKHEEELQVSKQFISTVVRDIKDAIDTQFGTDKKEAI